MRFYAGIAGLLAAVFLLAGNQTVMAESTNTQSNNQATEAKIVEVQEGDYLEKIANALAVLNGAASSALKAGGVDWIDTNPLIDDLDSNLQGFYRSDAATGIANYVTSFNGTLPTSAHVLSGWPHPDESGAAAIAEAIPL